MDDSKIISDYLAREKADMATMRGADHKAIIQAVADDYGVTYGYVRRLVIGSTFTEPN